MQKGDLVLVPFPFTDLTGSKLRPALILTVTYKDVIVAFITTQLKLQKATDIELSPSLKNGLKKDSVLLLDKIATLEKNLVVGKLGELSVSKLAIVDNNLLKIFQIKNQ
jgi:mRNA interferase MazF